MFKKVVLVVVVSFMALVMLAVAVAGVAAAAGLATAAAVIEDSGVVQAFEEVAEGADRLQIDVQENSVTFTNPDSGESRTVTTSDKFSSGRVQVDLPEVRVTDADGETVVVSRDWYADGAEYGTLVGLRMVGNFLCGLFVLAGMVLVAAAAYVLLRKRGQAPATVEAVKGEDIS